MCDTFAHLQRKEQYYIAHDCPMSLDEDRLACIQCYACVCSCGCNTVACWDCGNSGMRGDWLCYQCTGKVHDLFYNYVYYELVEKRREAFYESWVKPWLNEHPDEDL
jgi:hypothetical protein